MIPQSTSPSTPSSTLGVNEDEDTPGVDDDPVEAAENGWDPDYKHDQLLEAKGGVEGGMLAMSDSAIAETKTDSAV